MGISLERNKNLILVGTYRKENESWIEENRLYNLPVQDKAELELFSGFTHVILWNPQGKKAICRTAKALKIADSSWLSGKGYALTERPHGNKYVIFELGEALPYGEVLSSGEAKVLVMSQRWEGEINEAFYERPYPDCGGKSVPFLFDRLKPYFKKLESCFAFNPEQLDFFNFIAGGMKEAVPFPSPDNASFTFIDLFAGIGGIRLGYQHWGGKCVFSSEWDEAASKTYSANFGEVPYGDIQKIDPKSIPDFDILLAGFPCQPFSIIGDREGFNHETQGTLFFNIERILQEKKPKAFMLENVRNLTAHDGGRTFKVIISHLKKAGYDVHYKVLNALDYGVPQKRERIIICGFRSPVSFEFPNPLPADRRKTVADIIEKDADKDRTLFVSDKIRESRLERIKDKNYPKPYISHENVSGNITPHNYSCALRAGASANYILINDERRPSSREMLRIQGFPDSFKIVVNYGQIKHQTGNSVAVPMIQAVAEKVVNALKKVK